MESDREVNDVLMNINRMGGGISSLIFLSARVNLALLTFVYRMAKKGLVSAGFADQFKQFVTDTKGEFTVYNIPISSEQTKALQEMNELQVKLETHKNPITQAKVRARLKELENSMPEVKQLSALGISHTVLPKVNGSENMLQVAVANKDAPVFKNWFLNHLNERMTGGSMTLSELKAFTEGNYSIFNLPFEGDALETALSDFGILELNYSVLPDLNVGDNSTQIAIPNADRGKLESWFKMWKDKELEKGRESGDLYEIDENTYLNSGETDPDKYISSADEKFQDANMEFEDSSKPIPWNAAIGRENSEEFVHLMQDKNFEKISINRLSLVENKRMSAVAKEMEKNGMFISRIPGTYGEKQELLILPKDRVFEADDGRTYVAFLPKNETSLVMNRKSEVSDKTFADVYEPYNRVNRSFAGVQKIKEQAPAPDAPSVKPKVAQNRFNNFEGRGYDMAQMEKALLNANVPKLPK